jgi:twitching motility protein PilT
MDQSTIDALLTAMLQSSEHVSDLLFLSGKPPLVEAGGRLRPFTIDTLDSLLTPELIETVAGQIMGKNARLEEKLLATGACDCGYELKDIARLRVNVFRQNGRCAIVMRKLQTQIPTFETLGLPPIFREIVREKNGIILVTGAAGNGKSTTLASLVNELNQTQDIHIVTLEDPIEFVHPHGRAAVTHRELGKDFPTFAEGLRSALRQAPKVILVGEIRDRDTMEIAMTAAETGHLVLSTLHTINAGQSINRVLGFFNHDEESLMRDRFAETLRYIVSQRLIHTKTEGRLLITEVMGSNLRTRETIRCGESESKSFHEIIEASDILGWHTFDQSLLKARELDLITDETAIGGSTNKTTMRQKLDFLAKRSSPETPGAISGLKLDPRAATGLTPEPPVLEEAGAEAPRPLARTITPRIVKPPAPAIAAGVETP